MHSLMEIRFFTIQKGLFLKRSPFSTWTQGLFLLLLILLLFDSLSEGVVEQRIWQDMVVCNMCSPEQIFIFWKRVLYSRQSRNLMFFNSLSIFHHQLSVLLKKCDSTKNIRSVFVLLMKQNTPRFRLKQLFFLLNFLTLFL